MQSVTFPIAFPGYVYKVEEESVGARRWRYGILDQDFGALAGVFDELEELGAFAVSELLHLEDLPETEDVPDSLCSLSDDDWAMLNRSIELHAGPGAKVWQRLSCSGESS